MSSILKSLKKLEEEKTSLKQGSNNVSRDILKGDVPKRKSKSGPSWQLIVFLLVLIAGGILFLRPQQPAQVANKTPAVNSELALPAAPTSADVSAQASADHQAAAGAATAQDVVVASKETAEALKTTAAALQETATVLKDKIVVPKETVSAAPAAAKPKIVSKPVPRTAPTKETLANLPEKKIDLATAFPAPLPKIKPVPMPPDARTAVWSLSNKKGSTKPVLKVSEIHWRNEVRERLAVVNDLPVMEGVVIDGAKVDRIFKDRIRFVVNGQYQEVLVSAQR